MYKLKQKENHLTDGDGHRQNVIPKLYKPKYTNNIISIKQVDQKLSILSQVHQRLFTMFNMSLDSHLFDIIYIN